MPLRSKSHWGPFLWGLIHTITVIDYDMPHNQEHFVKQALHQLRQIYSFIPCKHCANHYKEHLERLSEEEAMKPMRLFQHMVELHNEINRKLGKPEMEYELAIREWCKTI